MEGNLKRLLSLAVVAALVFSLLPGGLPKAAAAEADPYENVAESSWQDWSGGSISESGYYRLTGSVTLEKQCTIASGITVHIDLNGHVLTAAANTRALHVNENASLSITDLSENGGGTVQGNGVLADNARGGLVYINGGTLILYKGTICGGESAAYGGNIYATNSGTIRIAGGTVTGGKAADGGNIALMYSNLEMTGGTVSAGSATSSGGNIMATGSGGMRSTVTISGGTVENVAEDSAKGSIYTGGGSETISAVVTISGGSLYGETYAAYAVSLTVSGAPVIQKLRLGSTVRMTPKNLEAGASIHVTTNAADNFITGKLQDPESYIPYVFAYEAGKGVGVYDSALIITEGCICGCGTAPEDVIWQPVTYDYLASQAETGALYGGQHYYLAENLTLTADVDTLEIYGNVTLDLRGKTVTPTEGRRTVYVNQTATLNLLDSVGSGMLIGGNIQTNTTDVGGAIHIAKKATLNMYSGTIDGGTALQGGNIFLADGATANLYGGTVSGGTADGTAIKYAGRGGNIYVSSSSKLNISGTARVTGGTAVYTSGTTGRGGNIFAAGNGILTISGSARVTGGSADKYAGNIFLTGSTLTISGSARVTGGKSGGNNADNIDCMYSKLIIKESAYVDAGSSENDAVCTTSILITGSTSTSGEVNNSEVTISGGTLRGIVSATIYASVFNITGNPVINELQLADGVLVTPNAMAEGASIKVTTKSTDGIITGALEDAAACAPYFHSMEEGKTVVADGDVLRIHTGCPCGCENSMEQLVWTDWTGEAITESGHYRLIGDSVITSEVSIASGLEVTIDLYGKTLTARGCRVFYVAGTLNIVDTTNGGTGTITGGTATKLDDSTNLHGRGGNIYATSTSELNLYSGNIQNGTATSWTVLNDKGKVVSASGLEGYGGNIYAGGIFNMYGGSITGGTSNNDTTGANTGTVMGDNRGGNIYVNGTFNMYGGTISGGYASRGGNICSTGNVRIYDGNILDGNAVWGGGNIISTALSRTVSIYGGNISGGNNDGIYMMYSTLRISGGTISDDIHAGNSSTNNYSVVYITGGTITGKVYDNSSYNGDNSKHTFVISGGTMSNVMLTWAKTLVISGAPTISNLTLGGNVVITPVELSQDASITLTAVGKFTTEIDNADEVKSIITPASGETVKKVGKTLVMSNSSRSCGTDVHYLLVNGVLSVAYTGTGSGSKMSNYDSSYSNRAPWYSSRTSIKTVVIRDGVTAVGKYAFYGCSGLYRVTLASSVTTLGSYAFYSSSSLASVDYKGTESQWNAINKGSGNTYLTGVETLICTDSGSGVLGGYGNGSDMTWDLIDGVLEVHGTTAMPNYYYGTTYSKFLATPWAEYADQITEVVVDGVTTIGSWAFANLKNLTRVTIDTSVETIGNNAFRGCTALKAIDVGNVTTIENNAFHGCTALEQFSGSMLSDIYDYAFYGCESLASVTILSGVNTIYESTFRGCTALTDATIGYHVMQDGALYDKDMFVLVHAGAVSGSFTLPSTVEVIGDYAFAGNTTVTSVTLHDGVETIGDAAFDGCTNLQTVTLGSGVTNIGNAAFANTDSLEAIQVSASNSTYASGADGALYTKDMTTLLRAPGSAVAYTVADTVTTVGESAFANNNKLTQVVLPANVTSVGQWAFSCASKLTTVTVPAAVTKFNYGTFEHTALTDVHYTGTTAQWKNVSVAAYNEPLSAATIHCVMTGTFSSTLTWTLYSDGKLVISGTGAMNDYTALTTPWYAYNEAITSVVVEEGVESIGANAFAGCADVTEVILPVSVKTIGANAFADCAALDAVSYGGGANMWNKMTVAQGNENLTSAEITYAVISVVGIEVTTLPTKQDYMIGDTLDTTGMVVTAIYSDTSTELVTEGYEVSYSFTAPGYATVTVTYGELTATFEVKVALTGSCGDNLTFVLSADGKFTVTGTGEMTSYQALTDRPWNDYVTMITALEFGEGITRLGKQAFEGCENLTSVVIPEGVKSIATGTFRRTGLKTVQLPNTLTSMGNASFAYCNSLTEVTIPDSVTQMLTSVFHGSENLAVVHLGEGLTSIADHVFYKTALTDVYYAGSRTQWSKITVSDNANDPLFAATMHYAKKDVVSVAITTDAQKTSYYLNETLDTTGLVLTVTYDDNSTEQITEGYTTAYDFSTDGTKTVTVSYKDFSDSYDVTVLLAGVLEGGLTWSYVELDAMHVLLIEGTGEMPAFSQENPAPWAAFAERFDTISIAEGVTSVGANAFNGMSAITQVILPVSVAAVGENAFNGCTGLTTVSYAGTLDQWKQMTIADGNEPLTDTYYADQGIYGDANGDGVLTPNDATLILKYLAGWNVEISGVFADANGDGQLTPNDATLILKYLAGWNVSLGAG